MAKETNCGNNNYTVIRIYYDTGDYHSIVFSNVINSVGREGTTSVVL